MNRNARRARATKGDVDLTRKSLTGFVDARLAAHQTHTNDRIQTTVSAYHEMIVKPMLRRQRKRFMKIIRAMREQYRADV